MKPILIVDDEAAIAELIRRTLAGAGYDCVAVTDGAAAADLLEREAFDLVLLDIMMPGVDGYDLLRWLLEHETAEALGGAEDWQAALLDAFRYIRDNHMVIYHIYRSAGRDNLLDCPFYSLARAIASASLEREARELRLPEADADFLTDFYMYAIAGVMIGWFAGDMREEPEELVGRLSRLLEGEFRRSAEKFAPEETAV